MKQLITLILAIGVFGTAVAQTDPKQMTDKRMDEVSGALKKEGEGWTKGGDLGLNLNGLGILNPRPSDGANQVGLGGLVGLFANSKKAKSFWENSAMLQLGVLRNGGKDEPFIKSADLLRLNSTWGYAIKGDKIFFAVDGRAETQALKTHEKGRLKEIVRQDTFNLVSQFLSPASLLLAPGIVYKPTSKLSFFASPIAFDYIYVGNEDLRASGALGNEPGKASRTLLGPALRVKYTSNYLKDRLALNSSFGWNATYNDNLNGRALWTNQLTIQIFKGLGLKLLGEAFWDNYAFATVDRGEITERLSLAPTYRGGFFLTYATIFK
jgi:hypothetical protein